MRHDRDRMSRDYQFPDRGRAERWFRRTRARLRHRRYLRPVLLGALVLATAAAATSAALNGAFSTAGATIPADSGRVPPYQAPVTMTTVPLKLPPTTPFTLPASVPTTTVHSASARGTAVAGAASRTHHRTGPVASAPPTTPRSVPSRHTRHH